MGATSFMWSFFAAFSQEELQGARPETKTKRIAGTDQEEIEDPVLLSDPDSCFCEFNGVKIHHKIFDSESSALDSVKQGSASKCTEPTKRINYPMILLHGFGASLFSWHRVMKPLARITGSKVLAFDRPAFGLTSRVDAINHSFDGKKDSRPLNPYSMPFSIQATHYFINTLAAEKAILVGHSAGALVAVNAYFHAPERVAALILVCPAIFAPFPWQKTVKKEQTGGNSEIQENDSYSTTSGNLFSILCSLLLKMVKYVAQAIVNTVKGMANVIDSLYKKVLSNILRSAIGVTLIRMFIDRCGVSIIRSAWYNSNQFSDYILQGYTKPLKIKGWDKALLEFTVATLTDSDSQAKPSITERLNEISCPVLIVTGDTDRIVPAWNSQRLSQAIPGSSFVEIKKCGHLPQEEKPEEFLSSIDKFLRAAFGVSEEPLLQPAT
ncbi:uncharacterized protein LOC127259640 isoform X2 [Andrographis paniculata]|uniref:uncharacterized protein LOC127259640 isoform X2 n=1 Tax=Andrographis paniculata TaxID=175694 RepID=UPI0021E83992|nr:uncharacterized protein LOC127259640 isoform X2 [Andrographis paniculata]